MLRNDLRGKVHFTFMICYSLQDMSGEEDEQVIVELRGHVTEPGIHWSSVFMTHVVTVYTGIEIYRNLKVPSKGNITHMQKLLEESYEKQKRVTIDFDENSKEIVDVRER